MEQSAVKAGSGRRWLYLDAVRVAAILLVLFIHSGRRGSYLYLDLEGSWTYWPALANGIFCWVAVPLFFMASGALLLGREESFGAVLRRFLRFGAVLLLVSALQYLWQFHEDLSRVYLDFYLRTVYGSYMEDTYWFLYTYLGYLLALPLLRRLAAAMRERDYGYMVLLYAALKLLQALALLRWQGEVELNVSLQVFSAADYVFYPLLGHYLHRYMDETRLTGRNFLLLLAASLAALTLNCLLVRYAMRVEAPQPGEYYRSFLYVVVITVYFGLQLLLTKHPPGEKAARVLHVLSECSFGVYLFESFLKLGTERAYLALRPVLGALLSCWVWIALTFLLGCAVTWVLKKIPGLRRLL